MPKMCTNALDCIILVCRSSSMIASRQSELRKAFADFENALQEGIPSNIQFHVSVISYADDLKVECDFIDKHFFSFEPSLDFGGSSALNKALVESIRIFEERAAKYRMNGVRYYTPILLVFGDGTVSDEIYSEATRTYIQSSISANKVMYFPVGIGFTNVAQFQSYYPKDQNAKPVLKPCLTSFKDVLTSAWDDDIEVHVNNGIESEALPFNSSACWTIPIGLEDATEIIDTMSPPTITLPDLGEDEVDYPVAPATVTIPLDDPDRVSPCVFLIDRSSNISSKALTRAEQMIQDFCNDLESSDHIKDAEICVISYAGDVTVDVDFCESSSVKIPSHIPSGDAAFNEALLLSLDKLEQKQKEYSACGKHCRTPIIFAVGTGISTDPESKTAVIDRIQQRVEQRDLHFYAIGCGMVDVEQFCSYYGNYPFVEKAVYPTIISALSTNPIVSRSLFEPITITLDL